MKPIPSPEDREEFGDLLDECLPDLYRMAHWLSRDPGTAEDLVQEASYRAFRRFDQFEKGTRFKAWILRILHNYYLDLHRKRQRHARPTDFGELDPEDPSIDDPRVPLGVQELDRFVDHVDEAIAGAIDDLPPSYRTVFLFFALGDLSYDEIARSLDIPIGTVMSRLYRARQQLQRKLVDYATEQGLIERTGR